MEEETVGQDKISGDVQGSSNVAIGKGIRQTNIDTGGGAHIEQQVNNYFGASDPPGSSRLPQLSKEAIELLKEAVQDDTGSILFLRNFNGPVLQTNNRNLISSDNPRERAAWEAAIAELKSAGFIVVGNKQGNIYDVTKAGYDAADQL